MGKVISKISKKWQLVVYITLMTGAVAFFISTLLTPKYKTETTFLVLQKDVDIASAAQSAEYLSEIFAQVAFTEPFIDSVLDSPFQVEKELSFEPVKKQKQWREDVIVKSAGKAGILEITVLDKSRVESRKVAQAIAHSFSQNSSEYYGGRGTIEIKPINGPTTSDSPVSPNILLNTVWGLALGFVVSILLSLFYKSFDLKLIGKPGVVGEMVGDQLRRQLAKRQERKELIYEPETEEIEEDREPEAADLEDQVEETDFEPEEREEEFPEEFYEEEAPEEKRQTDIFEEPKEEVEDSLAGEEIEEPADLEEEAELPEEEVVYEEQEPALEDIEEEKRKAEKETEPTVVSKPTKKGGFLSRLYGKSLFSDKKLSKLKKERTTHERELPDFDDPYLPQIESVKKVTPEFQQEIGEAPQENRMRSREKKAPAPENLPIFMSEEENLEEKKEPEVKEFSSIEHVEMTDQEVVEEAAKPKEKKEQTSTQKEKQKKEKSFEEMVLSGELQEAIAKQQEGIEQASAEIEQKRKIDPEEEPTEDEVKERLNRLLKGEL